MASTREQGGGTIRKRIKFREIHPNDLEIDKEDKFHERGQFGEVKKAKWNNNEVAVKYFTSADRKGGFTEELKNLSTLQNHERIVKLFGACNAADQPFIVLEFAPLSLEKVIHDKKGNFRYTSDNAINWLFQMADGLEYIHSKNLLHRDVKPSNVLLFDKGRVLKLCDFGTAKTLETTLTNAVGTIRYMAPEVVKSQHYTHSCDVFSFGMVAWEVLARRRAMLPNLKKDAPPMSILYAMAGGARPIKLANIPKVVTEMIDCCWHAEPEKRPEMAEIRWKLLYLSKFVELTRPLISRRQAQPAASSSKPRSSVEQVDERSPEPERKHAEGGRGNGRPHSVRFAQADEVLGTPSRVEGGRDVGEQGNISASSTAVAGLVPEMEQMRVTEFKEEQMDMPSGEFRPRHYTESFIRDVPNDQISPSMLRKQVSYPAAQGQPENYSSYMAHAPRSIQGTPRYNAGLGAGPGMEGQEITDGEHVRQPSGPQLTSTPRHLHAPPPLSLGYQPKFPQATEESSFYKRGLEQDLQPVLPNTSNAESMDVHRQYATIADKLLKLRKEYDKLLEERSNLDQEVAEDQQRLQSKEGIQREYHEKLKRKELLMAELKNLQETYNELTKSSAEHR